MSEHQYGDDSDCTECGAFGPLEDAEPCRSPVDRPEHYDGDECMVEMEAVGWGRVGCLFNIGKYLWRIGRKNPPRENAQKVLWYAKRFRETGCAPLRVDEVATLERCWTRGAATLSEDQIAAVLPTIAQAWNELGKTDG